MDRAIIEALRKRGKGVADAYMEYVGNPARQLVGGGVRGYFGLDAPEYADALGMDAYRNAAAFSNVPGVGAPAGAVKAMAAAPLIAKALRAAPREEALESARKNAVKMLGLPENNTPMDRAKALGFVDAYHGTASDISRIDPAKFGSATGAKSAKQAFWAVDDPTTARGYAEYAATDAKVKQLIDAANKAEAKGNWDLYDDLIAKAEALESSFSKERLQGQNIMPLMVRTNKGVRGAEMDAKGAEFVDLEGGVNRFLAQAIRDNRDIGVIRNLSDDVGRNNRPATHFAAINPSVVRSRFAAFDPARVNENDLLGRADPKLLAALAAGTTTAATVSALRNNSEEEKKKKREEK
jgi:hypothetical protein